MSVMLETLLLWLAAGFVIAVVVGVFGYFALRWVFMKGAEKMAAIIDRRVGGAAAHAFTGIARFAQARGIGIEDAKNIFGVQIDRLAKIMDSAITLPIIGRVGLDAVLGSGAGVRQLRRRRGVADADRAHASVRAAAQSRLEDAVECAGRRPARSDSARRASRRYMV